MNTFLFAGFLLADLSTTTIGIQLGLNELNPLAESLGVDSFLLIKGVASFAVVLLAWRLGGKLSLRGIQALTVLLAIVSFANSVLIFSP